MTQTDPSQRYLEVQVNTAAKDDLLILLVDGGLRFAEGALLEMERGSDEDGARRSDLLVRSQKIVLELLSSLSPEIGPELYSNLMKLYRFTFFRLFEGNVQGDMRQVREGVFMLRHIRDMWREAVDKARRERPEGPEKPSPNSSISVTG